MENQFDISHLAGHAFSAGAIGAGWLGVFGLLVPPAAFAASSVAFIWYLIQIIESPRTQRYLRNRRERKIARLKAHLLKMEAKVTAEVLKQDAAAHS